MAESLTSRLVMPGLALVALGAIVAVYLTPIPALKPSTITGSPTGAPPFEAFARAQDPDAIAPVVEPPREWTALVEGLERLRDKPVVTVVETPTEEQKPAIPARIPLDWRYIGFAGTSANPSAFVTMSGMQRVVFVNQVFPDIADPSNQDGIVIRYIEPERLVVARGGTEEVFALIDREEVMRNPRSPTVIQRQPPTRTSPPVRSPSNPGSPGPNPGPAMPGIRAR